jgi:hypothetical protein
MTQLGSSLNVTRVAARSNTIGEAHTPRSCTDAHTNTTPTHTNTHTDTIQFPLMTKKHKRASSDAIGFALADVLVVSGCRRRNEKYGGTRAKNSATRQPPPRPSPLTAPQLCEQQSPGRVLLSTGLTPPAFSPHPLPSLPSFLPSYPLSFLPHLHTTQCVTTQRVDHSLKNKIFKLVTPLAGF